MKKYLAAGLAALFVSVAAISGPFAVSTGGSSGGGSGTVTSVGATGANGITVTGSPVTTAGTVTFALPSVQTGTVTAASITATSINGTLTSVTGTLTGSITGNAATVTTNANLTGPITSTGNATAVGAQTGTGSTFVMQSSPTLNTPTFVAPALGTPSSGVATNLTGTASGLTAGTATNVITNANLTGPITSVGNATSIASQTGTGTTLVTNSSPTINTPTFTAAILGTPQSGVATNLTGTASGLTAGTATVATTAVALQTARAIAGHNFDGTAAITIACGDLSNGATGCSTATGTSGATIPLLNGTNTWSGAQSHNSGTLVLKGATSGTTTLNAAATAGSTTITLPGGTTDFSATGGTSQVVKQTSSGGAFTVARLACADLSDSASGCTSSGATPGGSSGQFQYNSASTFAGTSTLTLNTTTGVITASVGLSSPNVTATTSISTPQISGPTNIIWGVGGAAYGGISGNSGGPVINSAYPIGWVSGTFGTGNNAPDTALSRTAAKVVEINNGTAATYPGTALVLGPQTVAQLPTCSSTTKGARATATDATSTTFLATLTGSGSNIVPAFCNGTSWLIGDSGVVFDTEHLAEAANDQFFNLQLTA